MASLMRINKLRRRIRGAAASRAVTVPEGYKVLSTEKRAAQLLIGIREANGEDVPDRLRVTAAAPIQGRKLTCEEKVAEMEAALHDIRAEAAVCPADGVKVGLIEAYETMRAALAGER